MIVFAFALLVHIGAPWWLWCAFVWLCLDRLHDYAVIRELQPPRSIRDLRGGLW